MTDSPQATDSAVPTAVRSSWDGLIIDDPHFSRASDPFLAAWKRGIALAGPYLFDHGPRAERKLIQAKRDLRPNVALIQRAIGPMSPAEQFLLASLVSVHNAEDGGRLLKATGFHGFADLGRLDLSRRTVLAGLVLHLTVQCDFQTTVPTDTATVDSPPPVTPVDRSPWDSLAREERHFAKAPEVFLSVWKRGVALAGSHLFGPGPEADPELAQTKWDLCPKVQLIGRAMRSMRPLEQLFLAGLVSFYNAEDGGRLLKRAKFRGLIDLAPLDLPRRAVIAGLILNYTGW